jgi:hypothetical protein
MASSICVAPPALAEIGARVPALTRWAKICRAFGAGLECEAIDQVSAVFRTTAAAPCNFPRRKREPIYTSRPTPLPANHMREILMTEERKYAVLFAATILAARQLADLGDLADRPCPARDIVLAKAIEKAEMILRKIDQKYPAEKR